MTNRKEPSRGTAKFVAGSLTLTIGDGYELTSATAVPITLDWYWEPAISPTEDEPGCPEWLELDEIRTLKPVLFGNVAGEAFVQLRKGALLDNLLTSKQYEKLLTMFRETRKND